MTVKNIFMIFAVGILNAMVIYPLLHEIGHFIGANIIGARILEVSVFPLPNILCEIPMNNHSVWLIGIGGMLLPFALSMLWNPKTFWLWYSNSIIRFISLYALVLSAVNILLYRNDLYIKDDDIITVLNFGTNKTALKIAIISLIVLGIIRIAYDKPASKILNYFLR